MEQAITVELKVSTISNECKVDESIYKYFDFIRLEREITKNKGYESYHKSPYKVGTLYKDMRTKKERYVLIVSVIGDRVNEEIVGFYHYVSIYLDKDTNTWTTDNIITHSGNHIGKDYMKFISMEGDTYLREKVFTQKVVDKIALRKAIEEEVEKIINNL